MSNFSSLTNNRRLAAFAMLLVLAAAGCDSSEPSGKDPSRPQATISAKLVEHPYRQAGDSSLAARLSGSAPLIQLDSAFTRKVVPTRAIDIRVEGFGFDRVFIFMMEKCDGADEVTASVTVFSDDAEPLSLSTGELAQESEGMRRYSPSSPPLDKTCVMRLFAIDGFGADPSGITVEISRSGGGTYTFLLEDHVVPGSPPAITATAEDFEFSQGLNDVLFSFLTVEEGPTETVPLEVYRLNGGFDRWQASAEEGDGYLGDVEPEEPMGGVRYYVFPVAWPERGAQ